MADKLLAVSATVRVMIENALSDDHRPLSNNYGQFDTGYFRFRGVEIRIKPFLCVLKFSFKFF